MSRNEQTTSQELIEPALTNAEWEWEKELCIGPGRVNMTGENMYDKSQVIRADYLLRYRGIPMAILEAKSESSNAADGMQLQKDESHLCEHILRKAFPGQL